MSREDREYYIAALLIYHPFKAESYFQGLTDQELLREFERMQENV